MKNARFVLAGLAAVMILIGDCPTSEARCRLFGRRHRRSCASYAPCAPCAGNCGKTTDETWVCPVQQTPYYAGQSGGVDYYMFYTQVYNPNTIPHCSGIPQPAYLPAGTPTGCAQTNPPCWNSSRKDLTRPPDLADTGHEMTEDQLNAWGPPVRRHRINFGTTAAPEWHNIDFHLAIVLGYPPVRVALENPYHDPRDYSDAPGGHTHGPWDGHAYGRTVDRTGGRAIYYVLLKKQP